MYTKFGHTAFRVSDPAQGLDLVYNYGTFDFAAPGFYTSFAQGRLVYFLSRSRYRDFLYAYELEQRWVKEQVLDLPDREKDAVFSFLEWNYLPENRYYHYDFLHENCSTKIPEILKAVLKDDLYLDPSYLQEDATFRTLIQQNLQTNTWSSFGIDLALGSVIDRNAGPTGHLFLPEYVFEQLAEATFRETPLVGNTKILLDPPPLPDTNNFLLSPGFWIALIALIGFWWSFRKKKITPIPLLDNSLLLITGLLGMVITFLWWFTDHSATQQNFNILWAIPLNLVFFVAERFLRLGNTLKKWYFLALLILLGGCALLWIFGIQVFHPLLLPVWALLALRYSVLYRYFCTI